jgi:hypothetical protein
MNPITVASFADEFTKIAAKISIPGIFAKNPGLVHSIEASSGKLGKAAVPRSRMMTASFSGGKMVKRPLAPPPIPHQ